MSIATRMITMSVAGAIALAPAGCGAAANPGPTRAQYVTKANAICAAAATQIVPLVKRIKTEGATLVAGGAATPQRLAGDLRQLHTAAAGDLAQLRGLKQPKADHAAIGRFLTPLSSFVDAIDKAAGLVASGDLPQALALLGQTATVEQQAAQNAHAYGLLRCEALLPSLT
ncbi:MAG TPA: hypothetical protein VFN87_22390 [Solirubrobacteraceae bacterium]|nr:hypothetical protein [Solirubrobacteraceae bacterium]